MLGLADLFLVSVEVAIQYAGWTGPSMLTTAHNDD